jgi:YVTN family beta-propeller protein
VTHADDTFVLVLDRQTGREVARVEVGAAQANACFAPDGGLAFVTVSGADVVAVIDMRQLAVIGRIPTGRTPMGLALLDASR